MKKSGNKTILNRILLYEYIGFMVILIIIWLDEIIDVPHLLFRAPATLVNWQEALFETFIISFIGFLTIFYTKKLIKRLVFLEGMLQLCASCKKIRTDNGTWKQMEIYLKNHSDVSFSHGICPDCAKELYPEFNPYENNDGK